jgi:hypothetical protein
LAVIGLRSRSLLGLALALASCFGCRPAPPVRSQAPAFSGARPASPAAGGALEIARGPVIERLENRADGTEQSWRFAAAPGGRGDVVVRLAVAGQTVSGQTQAGLHFVDPATGAGVRYGSATWVDARGARTPASTRYAGGEIAAQPAPQAPYSPRPSAFSSWARAVESWYSA